jgi:plasmid stabilization system protein ParE
MPGGTGPIDQRTANACRSGHGRNPLLPEAGEAEIFYRLALGRACYSYRHESLYFVESRYAPVADLLRSVMHGLGETPTIGQFHPDTHRLFLGARRVSIATRHAEVIAAALRLAGIEVILLR